MTPAAGDPPSAVVRDRWGAATLPRREDSRPDRPNAEAQLRSRERQENPVQNVVTWSAAPLFGALLCVPVIGQLGPQGGPSGTQPRPGSASPQNPAASVPPAVPQGSS